MSASMTTTREQGPNMAQSAGTYLKAKHQLGTMENVDDIRWTDEEKENVRQEFLTCFAIARKARRITEKQGTNPTFGTVEEVMELLKGLEERENEARHNMREYMQHGPGKTDEKRFRDKVTNVRDITEVAVRTSISKAKEFLQNINDVDGTFAVHQSDCNEIIGKIKQNKKTRQEKGTTIGYGAQRLMKRGFR